MELISTGLGKYYMQDNYLFTKKKIIDFEFVEIRCRKYTEGCRAKGLVNTNTLLMVDDEFLNTEHNHENEKQYIDTITFTNKAKELCCNSPTITTSREIYLDTADKIVLRSEQSMPLYSEVKRTICRKLKEEKRKSTSQNLV